MHPLHTTGSYALGMRTNPGETPMIHLECYCCGLTATCVLNDVATEAWSHHMSEHQDAQHFGSWTWTAVQLPL